MTHFTDKEAERIYEASNRMTLDKWAIIRIVYRHWREARYGEADDILKEASDATADAGKMPLYEDSTIRRWMYAIDGLPERYWTLTADRELSFDHLEQARRLAERGFPREKALDWAMENQAKASQMFAHFVNPKEETPEERLTRRKRSKITQLRQLWQDPPQPVAEALDTLERYTE